jgi:hypothetical protein
MKLGMYEYMKAPEPIAAAYFINPSHQSVSLYVNPLRVATQRLGKNYTLATNTKSTVEQLFRTRRFLCGP